MDGMDDFWNSHSQDPPLSVYLGAVVLLLGLGAGDVVVAA